MNDRTQGSEGPWTVAIRASDRWARTGIHVDAGSRYRLSARGNPTAESLFAIIKVLQGSARIRLAVIPKRAA